MRFRRRQSGAVSIQVLILMVPAMFLFMGFAIDLGRLYLVRAELKQATNAMALAAATRLNGSETALDQAALALENARGNANGIGNKYNFGGNLVGESSGFLNSQVRETEYYDNAAGAIGEGDSGGTGQAGGTTAKYVRVTATAEAPLIFFGLISLGQERKTEIAAVSVAGQSAPLCAACGIENLAIAAVDASDTVNFGYTAGQAYTFAFNCIGNPVPQPLANTVGTLRYLVLDRNNDEATVFTDAQQQLFRTGLDGLPANAAEARACFRINQAENLWAGSEPLQCALNRTPQPVQSVLCGMASRFDPTTLPGACQSIGDIETLTTLRVPDTDLTELSDFSTYVGNGRRIITLPVVDALANGGGMTVLGFRQFVLQPLSGGATFNPGDPFGRFPAIYIGSVMPVRQGRFDGACGATSGPGKVVLYR